MMVAVRMLTALLYVVGAATVCCPVCDAQLPPEATDADWDFRYELFLALLEQEGLSTVTTATVPIRQPTRSVVVAFGEIDSISPEYVKHFCGNGGAMLLASDSRHYLGAMCSFRMGPAVTGNEALAYQQHADCIQIANINTEHPLMSGVGSLIVNRSGWLTQYRWPKKMKLNVAASLPQSCTPSVARGAPMLATVDAFAENKGQLIVCSDQSLFTNGMLWHGDNSLLAINVASLLASGQRDRVYFIVANQPIDGYQDNSMANAPPPKVPDLPRPGLETYLALGNAALKEMEQTNIINEALANRPRSMRPSHYWRGILFTLVFLIAAFVVWKICGYSLSPPESMPDREMKTAYAMQADRKIKSSEFGLAANMLARDLCRELTGSSDSSVWLRDLNPGVTSNTSALKRSDNQTAMTTIVDLAVNSQTVHISQKRFAAIGRTIQGLRRLHRNGDLLEVPS